MVRLRIDDRDLVLLINDLGVNHSLPVNLLEITGNFYLQITHSVEFLLLEFLFCYLAQSFSYLVLCYGGQRLHAFVLHDLQFAVGIDLQIRALSNHFARSGISLCFRFQGDFMEP